MTPVAVGALVVATLLLLGRPRPTRPRPPADPAVARPTADWVGRGRLAWPVLAVAGGWAFAGGWGGLGLGLAAGWVVHRLVAAAEPAPVRREREAVRRDLPVLVLLLASALRSGASTGSGTRAVCRALPGPAADRLGSVSDRLALGVAPEQVWRGLARDPELGALGRAMARADRTGAPVGVVMERLAHDLATTGRSDVEDRARTVGVRAALPLGVCLLPAFLLLGIAPLVASLITGIRL